MTGLLFAINGIPMPIPIPRSSGGASPPDPLARVRLCCGAPMILFFTMIFLIGYSRVRGARQRQGLRQRVRALLERAMEPGKDAAERDIVAVEGRVVGGAVAETRDDGHVYYREQILVEDARGQQINIGLPGCKEAPFACAAGEVIFAVGELARPAEGDEYRTTPIEALTAGSEHLLWVHRGDRAAAIAELNVQFKHDGGTEGFVFVVIGGLLALVSVLAVFMGPPP